jgi:divinyl chlorophyllide a 8-vinyl-reductase
MNALLSLYVRLALFAVLIIRGQMLLNTRKVAVAGATGYIGRAVVKDLVRRGVPTISICRSTEINDITRQYLKGSKIVICDVLDPDSVSDLFAEYNPSSVVCCIASRSGVAREAWSVDYAGGLNLLKALEESRRSRIRQNHFVLLSAFCVGKPLLQLQYAKLQLEAEIRESSKVTHSIIRPTAFFKSLDGQVDSVRKGNPLLFFGDGTCSANAISDMDLGRFLGQCALEPQRVKMLDGTRNVGGPDIPPVTKLQQANMIFDALRIPSEQRRCISIPLAVLDSITNTFVFFENIFKALNLGSLQLKCEDAAEITRIIKYYASEPMVAIGPGEVQGSMTVRDHFSAIASRGGQLEEVDKMTTTAGVLEVFAKGELVK